jgi:hypothetical protein
MSTRFGIQVWIENGDSQERVRFLLNQASSLGFDHVRLFLMWPMIEPKPGTWNFEVFDRAFDVARELKLGVRPTLTANSGPWHIGTPSVLHSQTGLLDASQLVPVREYIGQCVRRYHSHPSLQQWILWNEPLDVGLRTPAYLQFWRTWLKNRYEGNIDALNLRWRTGFTSFEVVPVAEEVAHPLHRDLFWNSYRPFLDDYRCRTAWLAAQIKQVSDFVREHDAHTPTCVNPAAVLFNQMEFGTDFRQLGAVVDTVGASYHPSWHFDFAKSADYSKLVAVGIGLQQSELSQNQTEVTELQSGPNIDGSFRPWSPSPADLCQLYLAAAIAGAPSITGWQLNTRQQDFESGDWSLLNQLDNIGTRAQALQRLMRTIRKAQQQTGPWSPVTPNVLVCVDSASQAIDAVQSRFSSKEIPGRRANDAPHGASLLTAGLLGRQIPTRLQRLEQIPVETSTPLTVVVSHCQVIEDAVASTLLKLASNGSTIVIDGLSGRRDADARLTRNAPSGFQDLGVVLDDFEVHCDGFTLSKPDGSDPVQTVLTRALYSLDAAWTPVGHMTYRDGSPAAYSRKHGEGQIVLLRFDLLASIAAAQSADRLVEVLCATASIPAPDLQVESGFALRAHSDAGSVWAIFSGSSNTTEAVLKVANISRYTVTDMLTDRAINPCGETLVVSLNNGIGLILIAD